MEFTEFVEKTIINRQSYSVSFSSSEQKIQFFFEDGTRADFSFDDWFCLLETADQIILMNDELCKAVDSPSNN